MIYSNTGIKIQKMDKGKMDKKSILNNKLFLYMTEFFAGMSVMAVELGASRLLAPYFSSSQIVWTIIIGTIMIAMALGNIYGGKAADKNPDPGRLYKRILIAAIWIAAIPVLGKYIIIAISAVVIFAVNSNFLVIAAFATCMIVFVFPLFQYCGKHYRNFCADFCHDSCGRNFHNISHFRGYSDSSLHRFLCEQRQKRN